MIKSHQPWHYIRKPGTSHHVQNLLQWKRHLRLRQKLSSNELLTYFEFSHSDNYIICASTKAKRQGEEALRSIPRNRLLVESDVHCSDHVILGASGSVAYLDQYLSESVEGVADFITQNGLRFLQQLIFQHPPQLQHSDER
jgi:hypothetical protein